MINLDNNINSLLGEAGINESERTVYMAGNATGSTSAELIQKTGMPRPTVLAALKELRNYGLCRSHRRDGRSLLYIMQPVQELKAHLGQKAREIDSLIDRIDATEQESTGLSVVEAEGQEGLKDLLERALRCKSRQWQIIAPRQNALRFLEPTYISYFKRVRSERQISSQTLWSESMAGQQITLNDVLMRKPRYVPKTIAKEIPTLLLTFDDSLLVIEGSNHPTAALITAPAVVATFRIVFEMAWRSAKN